MKWLRFIFVNKISNCFTLSLENSYHLATNMVEQFGKTVKKPITYGVISSCCVIHRLTKFPKIWDTVTLIYENCPDILDKLKPTLTRNVVDKSRLSCTPINS